MEVLLQATQVGGYRIDRPIGRGGMAIVYEATDESVGRRVALKVLGAALGSDREFIERFRREGRMQASLEHPNVVTVYEAGESAHGLYLAMQLVHGPTLAALLVDGVLDAERALTLLRQVASALDAAHAAGLVHRDVKPKNVLVEDGDHALLADFGLTKLGGESGVTVTGQLVGTLAYLAPEIIRGDPATPAADVYAYAAMVFECLSGGVVFPRATQAAQLYAHTSEPPPRISRRRPELPAALDPVFERALAKHPGERQKSATAVIDAVARALQDVTLADLGPPAPVEPDLSSDTTAEPLAVTGAPRSSRRRRAGMLAAAALAGAVISGCAVALIDGGDGEPARTTAAAPAPLAGATVLGSDLGAPGVLRDCRGGRVRATSADCTVAQVQLPDARVVVPADGAVRRWAVRSARGELALAVIRPREGEFFQIALSRSEFVGNDAIHVFDTDLAVERGDVLALQVVDGSGVGMRAAPGATTNRWIPQLRAQRPPDLAPGSGLDGELLLRAELVRGEDQRRPRQVLGAEAARLEDGRDVRRRRLRYANGEPVEIALVEISGRLVLDLFRDGRRLARQDLPGFRPAGGRLITFELAAEPSEPEQIGVYIEYANENSARILSHYLDAFGREFHYVN